MAIALLGASAVQAQTETRTFVVSDGDSVHVVSTGHAHVASTDHEDEGAAGRDSLMIEIRRYSAIVESMRDSLTNRDLDISLTDDQKDMMRGNIDEILKVIERIAAEISEHELEIRDNTISFLNESGEGFVFNIPENIDEHLSEGLHVITEMLLNDAGDSVDFDTGQGWDWTNFIPEAPPPPRKTVQGNIVKVGDDLHIVEGEDVRGHVVLAFGNAEISGRIDGNVVVVFGNLLLDDTAEVTGRIVSVGGGFDQDSDAVVGDVVSVDLWRGRGDWGLAGISGGGAIPFLMKQGTFLLTILLAMIAIMLVPQDRFANVTANLRRAPGPSLGLGLVGATFGFVVALLLMAVLILTVIGVPLALLLFLALMVAGVLAVGVCGAAIGGRLCSLMGQDCRAPWMAAVVGMTGLHLVSFLGALASLGGTSALATPLTILGVFIKVLAFLVGLGAIILSRLGSRKVA